jgi:hypothetical protein
LASSRHVRRRQHSKTVNDELEKQEHRRERRSVAEPQLAAHAPTSRTDLTHRDFGDVPSSSVSFSYRRRCPIAPTARRACFANEPSPTESK